MKNKYIFFATTLAFLFALMASQFADAANRKTVIVVGAGYSGIAAARKLVAANKGLNVIVLEARDKAGGRVRTDRSLGFPVEVGAQWIHGSTDNPITRLANVAKAEIVSSTFAGEVYKDGKALSNAQIAANDLLFERIKAKAMTYQNADQDQPLSKSYELASQGLSQAQLDVINFNLVDSHDLEYAASASKLSTYWFDAGKAFQGVDKVFPNGADQVTNFLIIPLDIQYKKMVTKIDSTGARVAVVANGQTMYADYVVVTVPLGILKANKIAFAPALSAAKQTAISRLGFGLLNKVILRFPSRFWPADSEWLVHMQKGSDYDQNTYIEQVNWDFYVPGTNTLIAFAGGDRAYALEKLTDAQIKNTVMGHLRKVWPTAPDPIKFIVSRWSTDPYTLGSYSYIPVNAKPSDYDALAATENKKVFFAGEHTNRKYPSMVGGAWQTGERAATDLLKLV